MNQPTLHTGLAHLLEASGVKSQYPDVVCFLAYHQGSQDVVGSNLKQLVKFRLLHPETPVLFFSFLPLETLLPKDDFGVLKLSGAEFIQLPCSNVTILQAAANQCAKPLSVRDAAWKAFSERACKSLLTEKIKIINHKQELAFVNKVGLGLRLSIEQVINYPEQRSTTLVNFNKSYASMLAYVQNPQITEIIELGNIVQDSNDSFLNIVSKLVQDFVWIADTSNKENFTDLRATIYRIQDSVSILEKLKPE
ncbi:MAG: hypothetical protein IPO21_19110 [Bacteroidales bacterium]|nr:hypothetical protein [Bacteroidales bacterium]